MKVVYIKEDTVLKPIEEGISLAVGFFDGLHLAHQELIKKNLDIAKEKGIKSGVLTFHPNPKYVLGKHEEESLITPHNLKINLLDLMGVDFLFVIHFDERIIRIPHQSFVESFILPLNVKHVVSGFDFHYGEKGKGTIDTLVKDGNHSFDLTVINELKVNDTKISSSKIREYIQEGNVHKIIEQLGRHYKTEGIVIHGFKRGRELGFPTANIDMFYQYVIPKTGVYIVKVHVLGEDYMGMCNVGLNPTFNYKGNKSIEVNILNFEKDIYNEKLEITWLKKIRDEKKFKNIEELVKQLKQDRKKVREFFKEENKVLKFSS
ncbi:riboflavin biosynthesis protein RibF [Haloplasma contractile]|uniref:Riboflavin biosynthesis protein n=1 Tax=Haloplasma contractile SSD-17B TaxID=1033810 RepID=U2FLQ5_9MOLU|nr:riboflavin biosynthesis protein RibF [Haloplasma contractile]ERJ13685.1 FMN adenylyltransferase protein [Haloplasma contractile SSD-17B]